MLLAAHCDKKTDSPRELRSENAHFIFTSNTHLANPAELKEGLLIAENFHTRLAAIIGEERMPAGKVKVLLEGDYQDQGPWFDPDRIHLFRYSDEEGGYWALFAHELGHAIREDWYIHHETWNWPALGFYDEGFAEFLAQWIDSAKTGFPFYGFPEDVVAGYFVANDLAIPMETLRREHEALNQPCQFQSYPQRVSWFRFIEEVYGRETLLQVAYPEINPTDSRVTAWLGAPLPQIDSNWVAWLTDRYDHFPQAQQLTQAYLSRTIWAHHCRAGEDY